MTTQYVFFEGIHPYSKYVFGNLKGSPSCSFAQIPVSGLWGKLNHLHTAEKLNRRISLPFKGLWYDCYIRAVPSADKHVVVFMEGCPLAYDKRLLLHLRKKLANAVLVYYFLNSAIAVPERRIRYIESNFDLIISYDEDDCAKRGWHHYCGVYSADKSIRAAAPCDVFFVGQNKGRQKALLASYERFSRWGLKCDYFITGIPDKEQNVPGIHYDEYLPYDKTLQKVMGARFLFENLQEGQSGCSFRTFEAIAYGKVLVTNNASLKNSRIFDKNRMLFYHDVSDISLKALLRCEQSPPEIDSSDLSPDLFISFLEETLHV
jgi:hypothetical protein